jgi:hypothetical protein
MIDTKSPGEIMKTAWIMAATLVTGWGTVAFTDQTAAECKKAAAQQLKTCLEKAPGPTAQEACKTRARKAQESCTSSSPKGTTK